MEGCDYDVFLSYSGPDTRLGFTDHLYARLTDAGVRTYRDGDELRVGEVIVSDLRRAIEQSKIFIPIFSKGYASSRWCLEELAYAVDCWKRKGHVIMPIFYDVEPSEVRNQTREYGEALDMHEKRKRVDDETICKWRAALKEVAGLHEWIVENSANRYEGQLVKEVVTKVSSELKKAYLVVSDFLVGVDDNVNEVLGMIGTDTNDAKIVGIHGMRGIGKTTLAKIVCNKLSEDFADCCFLANVRETSHRKGIEWLQTRLISDLSKQARPNIINSVDVGIRTIEEKFSNKKVLILLDDVDEKNQLTALLGRRSSFGLGSRILITTTKVSVLREFGVKLTYSVGRLDDERSLQLFSKHVFKRDHPPIEKMEKSKEIVDIAKGLPLILEVMGSTLSKYAEEEEMWDVYLVEWKKGHIEGIGSAEHRIDVDTASDEASQDTHGATDEIHEEGIAQGQPTEIPSQDGRPRKRVMPIVEVIEEYRSLFEAALKGDWEAIEGKLNAAVMMTEIMNIENKHIRVLDVAVMAEQDQLVENLVKRCSTECENFIFRNPLYTAARRGRLRMVKALLGKVNAEPEGVARALSNAIVYAPMQKEVIWYLAKRTKSAPDYKTMSSLIMAGHFDIGLYLAQRYPDPATFGDTKYGNPLKHSAIILSYFRRRDRLNFWQKIIYKCIPLSLVNASLDNSNDLKMTRALELFKILIWNLATKSAPMIRMIGESKLMHKCSLDFARLALIEKKNRMGTPEILKFLLTSRIVLETASHGITEILQLYLEHFPELMWDKNFTKDLIKVVVSGRHVESFRLVSEHNPIPYLTHDFSTNCDLMDAVIKWSPRCESPDVSGAAFLMQRELQWFKVVEYGSFPSFTNQGFLECQRENWDTFVKERKDLLKDAGQWMKDTSSSCSLVATLILTVTFSGAFTIPGGNDGNRGIPNFLNKSSFTVYAVADALALFSSVTATLMFLAILTSRYATEDFLYSLPRKMILGLTFLFLSLAFMLVAFSCALTLNLSERYGGGYILISLMAACPIMLFAILQLPLYVEMVKSTYRPRLYRPMKKIWK